MITIDNSYQHPTDYQNINYKRIKSYKQILVTQKKHPIIFEQIDMLNEDYRSLKSNSYYKNLLKEQFLLYLEKQYTKEKDSLKCEINNVEKYYQEKISKLNKKNIEHEKKINEQSSEIDRLNKIIFQKCEHLSLDDIQDFHCPISWEIFKDPVILEDGFTYERESISEWLTNHRTSPNTNRRILSRKLTPNQTLKNVVGLYQEIIVSMNNYKHKIENSQNILQVLTSEIESLSCQRDSIQEEINKKKKRGCSMLFF